MEPVPLSVAMEMGSVRSHLTSKRPHQEQTLLWALVLFLLFLALF